MLYETLKNIEKLIEGNEYSAGGVSYYVGIDKLEDGLPLELAVKKILLQMEAIALSEIDIVIIPIKQPGNDMRKLCVEWHLDEKICNEILGLLDDDTKMYRCCDDYEYISKGVVGESFRIIEKGNERILVDFYVVD